MWKGLGTDLHELLPHFQTLSPTVSWSLAIAIKSEIAHVSLHIQYL